MMGKMFELFALAFDKIPILNKIKGGRSILGFIALAIVVGLQGYDVGDPAILEKIKLGLYGFIGLSLNAKGRE